MRLHTISEYDWKWLKKDGSKVSDGLIRDSLGESIPPRGLEIILNTMFLRVLKTKSNSNLKQKSA